MWQPDLARARVARQLARHGRGLEGQEPIDRDALLGELDRRLQQFGERARAEALQREAESVDVAGNRERPRPVHVAVAFHAWPCEQIGSEPAGKRVVGGVKPTWRDRAEIHHLHVFFARKVNQHEADTTETAVPGLDCRQRKAGGDRRVDGVAAAREHFSAGCRGDAVLAGDDAVARTREWFAHGPVLHEMFEAHLIFTAAPFAADSSTASSTATPCISSPPTTASGRLSLIASAKFSSSARSVLTCGKAMVCGF